MGFKIQTLPATVYGCLTDFNFYRGLIRRPLKEAFLYLLFLLLPPVLLLSGIQVYETNRMMTRVTSSLQGNLPPLRIDGGKVIMDGEDYFRFENKNEFMVGDWQGVVSLLSSHPDQSVQQALRQRNSGEEISAEEAEQVAAFESRKEAGQLGQAWISEHFPEGEAAITTESVDRKLEDDPPPNPVVGELLYEAAHFFNFVFQVDLTTTDPQLPPGMLGFALGTDSYKINNPLWPQTVKFPETTSEVINDATLDSWRKSFIWQLIPILIGLMLLLLYLISLLFILGGAAVAGLTASLLKQTLAFRQIFALALYTLTPALLFSLFYLVLIFFRFNLPYAFWIFLAVYGFYLISAIRHSSSSV